MVIAISMAVWGRVVNSTEVDALLAACAALALTATLASAHVVLSATSKDGFALLKVGAATNTVTALFHTPSDPLQSRFICDNITIAVVNNVLVPGGLACESAADMLAFEEVGMSAKLFQIDPIIDPIRGAIPNTLAAFDPANPLDQLTFDHVSGISPALSAGLAVSTPNGLTTSSGSETITRIAGSANVTGTTGGVKSNSLTMNSNTDAGNTLGASLMAVAPPLLMQSFAAPSAPLVGSMQISETSAVTSNNGGSGGTAEAIASVFDSRDVTDTYQVGYAANLNVGDSVVNLTNAGSSPAGNICVNVYTFDASQELISCCSCLVTPNGLNSLSAQRDLISNTLTRAVPVSINIRLLASIPNGGSTCDPSSPTFASLAPGMRAWGTTIHALYTVPVAYGVTEEAFQNAYLSPGELTALTGLCGFIRGNAGGYGICKSCGAGGLGGAKR